MFFLNCLVVVDWSDGIARISSVAACTSVGNVYVVVDCIVGCSIYIK